MARGGVPGGRIEGATTPPLLNCLAIKEVGMAGVGVAEGGSGVAWWFSHSDSWWFVWCVSVMVVSWWFMVVRGGSVMVVSWWFMVVCGGLWWFRGGSWWFSHGGFMVVCGGLWWFSVVVLWWFVVVFLQKTLEKGHVTLYSTNHRPKFTMKSHF